MPVTAPIRFAGPGTTRFPVTAPGRSLAGRPGLGGGRPREPVTGLLGGFAGGLVGRAGDRAGHAGADRVLPVHDGLRSLLPWPGLRRGATVAVVPDAPGATSVLLALVAEAVRAGSWCAVVGTPALGAGAAAELGIDLGRLPLVPDPGTEWATVTAALLDGLDVVVVRPPGPVPPALARRLTARATQRGSVLIPYGSWAGADVTLRAEGQAWHGLGVGRGRLRSREVDVVSSGRGAVTRPRRVRLQLPGPAGGDAPALPATDGTAVGEAS